VEHRLPVDLVTVRAVQHVFHAVQRDTHARARDRLDASSNVPEQPLDIAPVEVVRWWLVKDGADQVRVVPCSRMPTEPTAASERDTCTRSNRMRRR
jgi:hypothetical protein